MVPTRVLLADDHQMFLEAIARLLCPPEFEVVALASEGSQASVFIERGDIDIAILDVSMPKLGGLDLTQRYHSKYPNTHFVILTMHNDPSFQARAKSIGARAFIQKTASAGELVNLLRLVRDHTGFVCTGAPFSTDGANLAESLPPVETLASLTGTERELLKYLAQGLTSKEIADCLKISFRTVQNHRANICDKLRLRGPNRLLSFAILYQSSLLPRQCHFIFRAILLP